MLRGSCSYSFGKLIVRSSSKPGVFNTTGEEPSLKRRYWAASSFLYLLNIVSCPEMRITEKDLGSSVSETLFFSCSISASPAMLPPLDFVHMTGW
jgi:hypothetical protein